MSHESISISLGSRVRIHKKGAAFFKTLFISGGAGAADFFDLDRDIEVFFYKLYRLYKGQIGISLAAAGSPVSSDPLQSSRCHKIGDSPAFSGKRRGKSEHRDKDSCADAGAAGAPVSAGSPGDFPSAAINLQEGMLQIYLFPGISARAQKSGPDHHMVLRSVHMAKRKGHHPLQDFYGIPALTLHTKGKDAVHSSHMTVITDIVPMDTSCLALLCLMTDGAFHRDLIAEIFQSRSADQAAVFHSVPARLHFLQ